MYGSISIMNISTGPRKKVRMISHDLTRSTCVLLMMLKWILASVEVFRSGQSLMLRVPDLSVSRSFQGENVTCEYRIQQLLEEYVFRYELPPNWRMCHLLFISM